MFRRWPRDETILIRTKPFFPFRADIPKRCLTNNPPNETPETANWEPVMPNVIAINAASRKHIADARATSDEMLLESIAKGGRTALNAALASCASGLAVMNIDNGFGAAHAALRILGDFSPAG